MPIIYMMFYFLINAPVILSSQTMSKQGNLIKALKLYKKMGLISSTFYPSGHAYIALLKACIALNDIESGKKLHADISSTRLLERDTFVGSSLVDMYAKCGSI